MTGRRAREKDKTASALRKLTEARQSGKRRTEDYELEEPSRLYDEVDEETYATQKAKDRRQVRGFIDNDLGFPTSDSDSCADSDDLPLEFEKRRRHRSPGSGTKGCEFGCSGEAHRERGRSSATQVRFLGTPLLPGAAKQKVACSSSIDARVSGSQTKSSGNRQSLVDELLAENGDWHAVEGGSFTPSSIRTSPAPALCAIQGDLKAQGEKRPMSSRDVVVDLLIESPVDAFGASAEGSCRVDSSSLRTPDNRVEAPHISDSEHNGACTNESREDDVDADALLNRVLELEAERAHEAADGLGSEAPRHSSGERVPSITFFAMDMHEVLDKIFIFGKTMATETKGSETVCIQVCGMEREIYFLPRACTSFDENGVLQEGQYPVLPLELPNGTTTLSDEPATACVYDEVKSVLLENGITEYSARQDARCFLPNHVGHRRPLPTRCLRVAYPAKYPALEASLEGQTFSQVIGTKNTLMERFVLESQIPGPCWMRVSDATRVDGVSSCSWSLSIDSPTKIEVLPKSEAQLSVPLMRVLSVSMRTVAEANSNEKELAVICGTVFDSVPTNRTVGDAQRAAMQFAIVRPLSHESFPFGFDRIVRGRRILRERNELAMIERFLTEINRLDPDVIVCHQAMSHHLDVLMRRMRELRVREWWHLGRLIQRRQLDDLRKSTQAYANGIGPALARQLVAGRLLCDTEEAARECLPREKDYSLRSLCRSTFGSKTISQEECSEEWSTQSMLSAYRDAKQLLEAIDKCIEDARLSFLLADRLAVIPLSNELASICGYLWSRTLLGNRAERIEYLLLHEIHRSGKYVAPDKIRGQRRNNLTPRIGPEEQNTPGSVGMQTPVATFPLTQRVGSTPSAATGSAQRLQHSAKRRKPAYQGGYVLEPKRGLYETCVLQLDFSSLYPSIIQEYNIDFTTVTLDSDGAAQLPSPALDTGILPSVLRRLVQRRRQVREAARGESDPVRQQQLHTRQLALKLTANAMYGCLGFAHSRFYIQELAELITRTGRETLERTVELAQETLIRLRHERFSSSPASSPDEESNSTPKVIYGDTDSIFIDSGVPFESKLVGRVMELGSAIRREVNKQYRTLEIEVEALYVRMLLLNKKKYAAMKYDLATGAFSKEVKGIEVVRHDWCALVANSGNFVLDQVLDPSISSMEANDRICRHLSEISSRMQNGLVDIDQYIITKQLSKPPDAYEDAAIQPHVQVALRRRASGYTVNAGTFIPYVICREAREEWASTNGSKSERTCSVDSIARRAYHPDEVRHGSGALHIDIRWYLENQLHATLSRMTECIPGLDAVALARCMGMNTQPFEQAKMLAESGSRSRSPWDRNGRRPALIEDLYGALSDPQVEPFVVHCPSCARSFEIDLHIESDGVKPATNIGSCPHNDCAAEVPIAILAQQLAMFIRKAIHRYYTSPYVKKGSRQLVSDLCLSGDGSRARRLEGHGDTADEACVVEREYGERTLYAQLERLQFALGNPPFGQAEADDPPSYSRLCAKKLQSILQYYLDACGYQYVEMSAIFAGELSET